MYSLLSVICVQYWWRELLDNICVFTEKRKKKSQHVTVSATKVITVTEITYIYTTGYGHVELHAANDGSKLPE